MRLFIPLLLFTFLFSACQGTGNEGAGEENTLSGKDAIAELLLDVTLKPDDDMAAMQARAKEKGFGFAYLLDADQSVYPAYGASKTPEIYLLDADMVVRYHGAIDDNAQDADAVKDRYVEMAVAALEAGNDPEPSAVKAIGCSIKAK